MTAIVHLLRYDPLVIDAAASPCASSTLARAVLSRWSVHVAAAVVCVNKSGMSKQVLWNVLPT